MTEFRYAAFISYSSKDAAFARRLHRSLEGYGIPASLGNFDLTGGGKKNRIYPIFRDREELSAGHLGGQIEENLKTAAALIVVCSPSAAVSPWVQKEIEFFVGLGQRNRIFAIISDTAPLVDEVGADCTQACFPPALRGVVLQGDTFEPLAADARKGKDGFRLAWLKIVAGLIGVTPGQIVDRDRKRRQLAAAAFATFGAIFAVAIGYAGYQAFRPISLSECASDRLIFADPWGGQRFEVERVGQYRRPVCTENDEACEQELVITVFQGDYRDPDGAYNGPLFYTFEETPGSAPCCWWDAAGTLSALGPEVNSADLRWYGRGNAPPLGSFSFSSIELDETYAVVASSSELTLTFNPMIAESCRQRPLF
jgi:hypothetical protein